MSSLAKLLAQNRLKLTTNWLVWSGTMHGCATIPSRKDGRSRGRNLLLASSPGVPLNARLEAQIHRRRIPRGGAASHLLASTNIQQENHHFDLIKTLDQLL